MGFFPSPGLQYVYAWLQSMGNVLLTYLHLRWCGNTRYRCQKEKYCKIFQMFHWVVRLICLLSLSGVRFKLANHDDSRDDVDCNSSRDGSHSFVLRRGKFASVSDMNINHKSCFEMGINILLNGRWKSDRCRWRYPQKRFHVQWANKWISLFTYK